MKGAGGAERTGGVQGEERKIAAGGANVTGWEKESGGITGARGVSEDRWKGRRDEGLAVWVRVEGVEGGTKMWQEG